MKKFAGILLSALSFNVIAANSNSPVTSVDDETIFGPNVVHTDVINDNLSIMLLNTGVYATVSTSDSINAHQGIALAFDKNPGSHWTSERSSYNVLVENNFIPSANALVEFSVPQTISKISIRIHQITPRFAQGVGSPASVEIYGVAPNGVKTLKHESSVNLQDWTDAELFLEFKLDNPEAFQSYVLKFNKGWNWTRFHTINFIP